MVNELTPMYSQLIKVHHSNLRPWVPRPNYLARFDLGGEVFPPPVRLNNTVSNNNARMPFGSSNHNIPSVPNNRIFNNFIGFQAATPPVLPRAPGGNIITPPVINELGDPLIGEVGGEIPQGPPSSQPVSIESPNFTPPRTLSRSLPNLFSPSSEHESEDSFIINHPFEGFPLVDPSTEEILTRMENLLTPPVNINEVPVNVLPMPSSLLPDELPIINPVIKSKPVPIVVSENPPSIPSTSTSAIATPSTVPLTDEPVISIIAPPEVTEAPPPPLNPNIGISPQGAVRGRSRIPVLSPIASPLSSRLRPSNAKPPGYYKK
ncbi:unnamed protein product [Rotaria socialis]|uniref:Uncharacterized protein n=1 Tax=Rotaria socialis TaxID=392032 RepID=A0A818GUS0_9BILA|nr:unnamed protein product [Rotaria socialis]CAF4927526.1 unnamed protein product [Rotaria socialis]